MHRSLSTRSRSSTTGSAAERPGPPRHRFTLSSLRDMAATHPVAYRKLFRLVKAESNAVAAHEAAAREHAAVATSMSDWGEVCGDDAVSDLSDKVAVLVEEMAEQEDAFAQALEDARRSLKVIRNIEASVRPSRENKAKITDEIHRLKLKEPSSTKIVQLEQELVRAEAQSLVAEAQLTNTTRQKFKEAYDMQFASFIERGEKQAVLARHGRRLLALLNDTPIIPGDVHPAYDSTDTARQIIHDAEDELRAWRPTDEPTRSKRGDNAVTYTGEKDSSNQESHGELTETAAGKQSVLPTYISSEPTEKREL